MKTFRELLATLQAVLQALLVLIEKLRERPDDDHEQRLQALETSRAIFEGEVAGALLKVEARHNAARAAEERVRVKTRGRARGGDDEEADFGPEAEAAAFNAARAHGAGSGTAQLHAVPPSMVADERAQIRARKWRGA